MKKSFLSVMALGALAAVGFGTNSTTTNLDPQNNVRFDKRNQNSQNRENQALTNQRSSNKLAYKPSHTPLLRDYYSGGIPPKIYGMYHVKRGTHKRTNI